MKRGTPDHPKLMDLCELLDRRRPECMGYLELLWHFAAKYAPRGDIGRFSTKRIEAAMDWPGRSGRLMDALVKSRWVDCTEKFGFTVHGWREHADESVKKHLQRNGLTFVQNEIDAGNLSGFCRDGVETLSTTLVESVSLPKPVPVPVPKPEPKAAASVEASAPRPDPEPPAVLLLANGDEDANSKALHSPTDLAAVDAAMRAHCEAPIGNHLAGMALRLYGRSWVEAWSARRSFAHGEKLKHGGGVLRCLARDYSATGADDAKLGAAFAEQERREAEFLSEQTARFAAEVG